MQRKLNRIILQIWIFFFERLFGFVLAMPVASDSCQVAAALSQRNPLAASCLHYTLLTCKLFAVMAALQILSNSQLN